MDSSTLFEADAARTVDAGAAAFAALADPARLQVLAVLAGGERCVCEIQERVPLAANLLSYHLRVLREAGFIESSRRGRWIDYRVTGQAGTVIADALAVAGLGGITAAAVLDGTLR